MCRGTTGAPCVAWFSVPSGDFVLLSGVPTRFRSSSHATRTFCATCGTQLTFVDDASAGETDVTSCSLDEPNRIAPRDHTYIRSKLEWLQLADGLPQYLAQRTKPGSDPQGQTLDPTNKTGV
jgi:hypothetical protein